MHFKILVRHHGARRTRVSQSLYLVTSLHSFTTHNRLIGARRTSCIIEYMLDTIYFLSFFLLNGFFAFFGSLGGGVRNDPG